MKNNPISENLGTCTHELGGLTVNIRGGKISCEMGRSVGFADYVGRHVEDIINSYDALKAKEALFDEACRAMDGALSDLSWIEHEAPDSNFQASILLLREILSKYKDIK